MLAIDLAFSAVKVKSKYSEFDFATAPKIPKYGNTAEDGIKVYEYRGQKFIFDDRAPGQVVHQRSFDYLVQYAPVLVARAIDLANIHPGSLQELRVAIPYRDYRERRQEIEEVLSDFSVSGVRYRYNVRCIPQGSGAFVEFLATHPAGSASGILLDIGFNTLIKIAFDGGSARKAGSEQFDHYGLSEAMGHVGAFLKSNFGVDKTNIELLSLFRARKFSFRGEVHDLSAVCDAAVAAYLAKTLREFFDKHSDELDAADQLVITGGGAHYITPAAIPSAYRGMTQLITDSPEFMNVRGMFRLE